MGGFYKVNVEFILFFIVYFTFYDTLFQAFGDYVYPIMGFAEGKPGQDKVDKLKETLGWVNDFVADEKFAAGTSQMTLADISLLATYSSLKVAKKYS